MRQHKRCAGGYGVTRRRRHVEAFEGLSLIHDIAEEQEAERVRAETCHGGAGCLKVRRVRCGARRDAFNGRYTAKITQKPRLSFKGRAFAVRTCWKR